MPFRLRFLLARDPRFVSEVLRIFLGAVCAWQRLAARRHGILGRPDAVTFVQRLGGLAANLNVPPIRRSGLPSSWTWPPRPGGPTEWFRRLSASNRCSRGCLRFSMAARTE